MLCPQFCMGFHLGDIPKPAYQTSTASPLTPPPGRMPNASQSLWEPVIYMFTKLTTHKLVSTTGTWTCCSGRGSATACGMGRRVTGSQMSGT
jgi:hypothetical protein